MTQKEVHNMIVLHATPEQKTQIAVACAMQGVKIQNVEQTIATVVTGISKYIRQQDLEYLNKIII